MFRLREIFTRLWITIFVVGNSAATSVATEAVIDTVIDEEA